MRATVGAAGARGGSACIIDRQAQLSAMLTQASSRGESAPEVQSAADGLLGPLYYRALFTGQSMESDWVRALVDALLDSPAAAAGGA